MSSIGGADPRDAALRRMDTFRVLKDFITVMTPLHEGIEPNDPTSGVPEGAARRWYEYGAALFRARPVSTPLAKDPDYFNSDDFRKTVLAAFVSSESQQAYWKVRATDKTGLPPFLLPLDELPSAEEVRRTMDGIDLDTTAMEAAVFNQLDQIVRSRSGTEEGDVKLSARERALSVDYARGAAEADRHGEYLAACAGAPLTGSDSYAVVWFRKRLAYDTMEELLRSTWSQKGKGALGGDRLVPWFKPLFRDLRNWNPRQLRVMTSRAGKASSTAAQAGPAWTPPAPDPSVSLARGASPPTDMTLFGGAIHLGEPFLLPPCPPATEEEDMAKMLLGHRKSVDKTCARLVTGMGSLTETIAASVTAGSTTVIDLPKAVRPDWVHSLSGAVENDVLVAVAVATEGDEMPDDLVRKYGPPRPAKRGDPTREWVLPGLHVVYRSRRDLPQPPDQIVIGTPLAVAASAIGDAAGEQGRALRPNIFIETETRWKSRQTAARKKKAENPPL